METLTLGSRGPNVKLIQSLLIRIGYNPGAIDGIFGPITRSAVIAFQRDSGIVADGIVGPVTWERFNRILRGYDTYTIRQGDTLFELAKKYYTTVGDIITANPGIDPQNLRIGQSITIPFGIDIVFTDIDYFYSIMERNIQSLKTRYPFIGIGVYGRSVLGKNLYYITLGNGPNQVHYNASHHALEWITTPLLMKFVENFSKAYSRGTKIRGYDLGEIWEKSTIIIAPMVNPDGVDLVIEGLQLDNPYYSQLLAWNQTGRPFSEVWQANIRGVDLNRNYPACWEMAKAQEPMLGVVGPGPTRYGGPAPLSEPETQALADLTQRNNYRLVLSYHSQGRVIYWTYKDVVPPRALEIAELFSNASGYAVADIPYEAAFAGYKDWFMEIYGRPGYTIEVGLGRNPLPIQQFNTIYEDNEEILLLAPLV
jgi:g-D-glutamyl-meso-diaminopimelate peptidase